MRAFACLVAVPTLVIGACGEERERRLDGEWTVHFTLEQPSTDPRWTAKPLADTLSGTIVVHRGFPPFPEWKEVRDEEKPYAIGRYFVDFGPFFGERAQPDSALPRADLENETGSWREIMARVAREDSVYLILTPWVSHGGFTLEGTLRGDTIVGTWVQHAYCCPAHGVFRMWRVTPSAVTESALRYARQGQGRPGPNFEPREGEGTDTVLPVIVPDTLPNSRRTPVP